MAKEKVRNIILRVELPDGRIGNVEMNANKSSVSELQFSALLTDAVTSEDVNAEALAAIALIKEFLLENFNYRPRTWTETCASLGGVEAVVAIDTHIGRE